MTVREIAKYFDVEVELLLDTPAEEGSLIQKAQELRRAKLELKAGWFDGDPDPDHARVVSPDWQINPSDPLADLKAGIKAYSESWWTPERIEKFRNELVKAFPPPPAGTVFRLPGVSSEDLPKGTIVIGSYPDLLPALKRPPEGGGKP